jgi:hypothetical protein
VSSCVAHLLASNLLLPQPPKYRSWECTTMRSLPVSNSCYASAHYVPCKMAQFHVYSVTWEEKKTRTQQNTWKSIVKK